MSDGKFVQDLFKKVVEALLHGPEPEKKNEMQTGMSPAQFAGIVQGELQKLERIKQTTELQSGFRHLLAAINSDSGDVRMSELQLSRAIFARYCENDLSDVDSGANNKKVLFAVTGNIHYFLLHSDIRNAALCTYRLTQKRPDLVLQLPSYFYPNELFHQYAELSEIKRDVSYDWSRTNFEERELHTSNWSRQSVIEPLVSQAKMIVDRQESWRSEVEKRYRAKFDNPSLWDRLLRRKPSDFKIYRRKGLYSWNGDYGNAKRDKESKQLEPLLCEIKEKLENVKQAYEDTEATIQKFSQAQIVVLEKATLQDLLPSEYATAPRLVNIDLPLNQALQLKDYPDLNAAVRE